MWTNHKHSLGLGVLWPRGDGRVPGGAPGRRAALGAGLLRGAPGRHPVTRVEVRLAALPDGREPLPGAYTWPNFPAYAAASGMMVGTQSALGSFEHLVRSKHHELCSHG